MSRTHGLSKSRFIYGMQCHKQLWWRVHEPDAQELEPDISRQAIFDQGERVGVLAREYVPGGVLIDRPYDDYEGRLADTQAAIDAGVQVIYEASLVADSVFVAVDILVREPLGWRVIEVKSATKLKEQYLSDVAVQVHTVRRAGLAVTAAEVMVLNRACTYPDLSNLFVRYAVTAAVEERIAVIPMQVDLQLAMLAGPQPEVSIGPHCGSPYACPFMARCWPPVPEHHVSTLIYMKRRAPALEAQGYRTIYDLPDGLGLNSAAERQRRAVQAGRVIVEGDLAAALEQFRGPLAFLDLETVSFAIPIWDGCHPYDGVAAQFSCHLERASGELDHFEWVPDAPGDPRAEIAGRIVAACDGASTVVAYNAGFEKRCLEFLAATVPGQSAALQDVIARLADPLPIIREHVYHPDFGGSFSLKSVVGALAPELGYADLEIQEGEGASRALAEIVAPSAEPGSADQARRREALLRYCERDTLAMVRVMERLRELAVVA